MQVGLAQCVNKGMQRDYSMDKASQEFAYENRNIRITSNGEESFLSVTNEKSTKKIVLNQNLSEDVTILGSATINDILVLFCKGSKDYIYKITIDDLEGRLTLLYEGNLDFSISNPIECIISYEGDEVLKVYWVDGKNQPRYINVFPNEQYPENTSFDFRPIFNDNIDVDILKEYKGIGNFKPGVVQYFITYYKKYGAETNSVYQSPLYYISSKNRGGNINEDLNCSFKITINSNTDMFDYVKVYSIIRTSLNIPQAYLVADVEIKKDNTTIIVEDVGNGIPIADTDILFLGGNTIIANTIEQKDNTLFLGNIDSVVSRITDEEKNSIKNLINDDNITIDFGIKVVKNSKPSNNQYYNYTPNIEFSSIDTTTFKYKEWYRFGIQFQLNTLEWTPTFFIKDIQNNIVPNPNVEDNVVTYNTCKEYDVTKNATMVYAKLTESFIKALKEKGFINWRLMVVPHTSSTRTIKAQGLVLPTLFNIEQRSKERCYASPIWSLGMCQYGKHFVNIDVWNPSTKAAAETEVDYESPLNNFSANIYKENGNNKFLLNNLYVNNNAQQNTSSLQCVKLSIWIHRIYARDDLWYIFDNYTGDIFAGRITVGIYDYAEKAVKEYQIVRKQYAAELNAKTRSAVYEKRFYGQRKKGCNNLSTKLKNLIWDDLKDFYLIELGGLKDASMQVKDIDGIDFTSRVFYEGEVPSGSTIRSWITPSNNYKKENYSVGIRNVYYTKNTDLINSYSNNYFIDANICNFISPEVENITEDLNFRLIGYTNILNTISDYEITVDNPLVEGVAYKSGIWNFNRNTYNQYYTGITSYPLWPFSNRLHYINYWNGSGYLVKTNKDLFNGSESGKDLFKLTSKKFANMWFMEDTSLFDTALEYGCIYNTEVCDNETLIIDNNIYNSNYENVLLQSGLKNIKIAIRNNPSNEDPINDSFDLQYINDVISKEDFIKLNGGTESVTIKYSSAKHAVFKLPEEFTYKEVLPNYDANISSISDVFGNANSNQFNASAVWYGTLHYCSLKSLDELEGRTLPVKFTVSSSDTISEEANGGKYGIQFIPGTKSYFTFKASPTQIRTGKDFSVQNFVANVVNKLYKQSIDSAYDCISKYNSVSLIGIKDNTLYAFNLSITNLSDTPASLGIYSGEGVIQVFKVSPNYNFIFDIPKINDKYLLQVDSSTVVGDVIMNIVFKYRNTTTSRAVNTSSKYFIGEFYTPYDANSFMGGTEDNVLEAQTFIPITGKYSIELDRDNYGNELEYSTGYGLEGDTYYHRWDHVRIYPTSKNDVNQNTDALSVMIETYQNLDADYRELRGRLDTTTLTTNNTNNVLNPVYNQINNYTTSSILDKKYEDSTHPTMYVWSLTKKALSDIDTWTSVNLSRSAKLDGDKGMLTKIKRWNNQLLVFQEKGFGVINFNQQTTISTDSGVPVEIAASGLVSGHYYISSTQGCKNKWSIISSPYGLYFIDSYNKSINLFDSEGIKSLSTINLFQDWILENEKGVIWNPNNTQGFKSFYDPIHKEVYFINDKEALCYNELLQQFTSFYDYGSLNTMILINENIYGIKNNEIHKMFEGEGYCNLFGDLKEYSMTYKINKDPFIDKTWTNIEYRADIFSSGNIKNSNSVRNIPLETFDTLEVWNEYQKGVLNMSKAKCKFRIWRADIPRDTEAKTNKERLNRIRNPWIMLKLSKVDTKRMEFHDLLIKYLQ